ncbi:MAG: insulinase family protein [Rikenellaceae bacterium]|jgi:zinc protease|nr:insulinase family protein [Rikenellaceae bacterium]
MKKILLPLTVCLAMTGCKNDQVKIDYQEYTLPNGLRVVLQQDHSDPVVAVAIQYHVGSAREKEGKTGFAHFFEHMLFQRSENLPRNAFFNKISELGGDFNGGTNSDGTVYYESVPRDALEKVLWMESDRMGFFINTVTQGGLEREIDVVSNEKRQMYDTRPYGQLMPLFSKYAFPQGHPYSWTTIGEIPDLRAATVEDVKEFYREYYKPNNATLVISGDFDAAQAKELVDKYFGEIPAGEPVAKVQPVPAQLAAPVSVSFEDPYASMPLLTIAFPTVERYHPDSYAVSMLSQVLADGKNSPLYKVLVDKKKLCPEVEMWNYDRELAGNMLVIAPAFPGVSLNDVYAGVQEAFAMLETEGFDETLLDGYKAVAEVEFYNSMGGVMRRALMMAQDDVFGGDPLRSFQEQERNNAVTKADVLAAYEKYIKGKNSLQISFVPKGSPELAVAGSVPAAVTEESISDQTMRGEEGAVVDDPYEHTPSAIDRSQEPPLLANTPALHPPHVWKDAVGDGLKIWGATNNELPLVNFSLALGGGMMADGAGKAGTASLYAETLLAGTADKTPEQLEAELKRLGASIYCNAGTQNVDIRGSVLARNLPATMNLLCEVLTKPRFDQNEFDKAQQSALANIAQQSDDVGSIASRAIRKVMYGGSRLGDLVVGTAESVQAITLDDLKAFHAANTTPAAANVHFAGAIDLAGAKKATETLRRVWTGSAPAPAAEAGDADPAVAGKFYFIDQPGSQQSMIYAAAPAMPQNAPDYYTAYVANYRLGDGSQSILFDELRLKRGYTYGAYSSFQCGKVMNRFALSTKVQGIKTFESVDVIEGILKAYAANYADADMELSRESIRKATYGAYETLGSLVNMLTDISLYDLPADYVKQRETQLAGLTTADVKAVAAKYIDPARMTFVIVGDAATQLPHLKAYAPVLLDKMGEPVKK